MKRAIAKIKLAPGNAGWFDPLTNIYLTLSKKECFVYNDQDVSNIRKAIKQNKLVLKEGRLPSPVSEEKKETVKKSIKKQIVQEIVKVEKDEVIKQVEVIEKKEIKPFIKEETIEEVKTEKTPKKKVKRRPDESKLLKQEEENKEEVVEEKREDVVDPIVKVAELIKVKAEDDNNG